MNRNHLKYSDHPIRRWFIMQSIEHSWRTIILSLIATIIMGSGIRFFTIDDDIMKILPKNMDSRIAWDAVQEEFGSTDVIFIAFGKKGKSIFNPKAFEALWDLMEGLEASNRVEEVLCISNSVRMDNVDGFMEVGDLQIERSLTENDIESIQNYLSRNSTIKKRFISENEDYFLILAQPYNSEGMDSFRNEVVKITNPILQDFEIHYGGQAYITGTMPTLIREDVESLMKAGILIMVFILLLNLRSVPGVAMVLMVIGLSLLSMMGFMGWIFKMTGSERFLFTMANTSMPIILLTIANSDGVHVITKFFKELRQKKRS